MKSSSVAIRQPWRPLRSHLESLWESGSEKPCQDLAWGSSGRLGAPFLPLLPGRAHHPVCRPSTIEPDGRRLFCTRSQDSALKHLCEATKTFIWQLWTGARAYIYLVEFVLSSFFIQRQFALHSNVCQPFEMYNMLFFLCLKSHKPVEIQFQTKTSDIFSCKEI